MDKTVAVTAEADHLLSAAHALQRAANQAGSDVVAKAWRQIAFALQHGPSTTTPDLNAEELGEVLFAARQIARKCERQLANNDLSDTMRQANDDRRLRLRAAIRKLKRMRAPEDAIQAASNVPTV